MKENQKKSFDFAADTTKQLITLATAIITLTVTFSKDIIGVGNDYPKTLLAWTWGVFIASLFFGIFALMALTGTLQPISEDKKAKKEKNPENDADKKAKVTLAEKIIADAASQGVPLQNIAEEDYSINQTSIRLWSILQIFSFIVGVIMTVVFGYQLLQNKTQNKHQNDYMIVRQSKLGADSTIYIDTLYLPKK
jgi:hypothetical protein